MRKLVCCIKGHRFTRHVQDDGHTVGHCSRCGYMKTLIVGWRKVNRCVTI
jgi:hypothetical protein